MSWILVAIVTVGGILLVFDQYDGANICFIATAGFIFAKIAHVAIVSKGSLPQRVFFTFLLFGVIGIALVETVKGVNNYARRKAEKEQAHTESTSEPPRSEHHAEPPKVSPPAPTVSGRPHPHRPNPTAQSAAPPTQGEHFEKPLLIMVAVGDDTLTAVSYYARMGQPTPLEEVMKCVPPFMCYTLQDLENGAEVPLKIESKKWARLFFRLGNLGNEVIKPVVYMVADNTSARIDNPEQRGGPRVTPTNILEVRDQYARELAPFEISNQFITYAFDISIEDEKVARFNFEFRIWANNLKLQIVTFPVVVVRPQPEPTPQ